MSIGIRRYGMNLLKLLGKWGYVVGVALFVVLSILLFIGVTIPDGVWAVAALVGLGFFRGMLTTLIGYKGWKSYVGVSGAALGLLADKYTTIADDPLKAIVGLFAAFGVYGVGEAIKLFKDNVEGD